MLLFVLSLLLINPLMINEDVSLKDISTPRFEKKLFNCLLSLLLSSKYVVGSIPLKYVLNAIPFPLLNPSLKEVVLKKFTLFFLKLNLVEPP